MPRYIYFLFIFLLNGSSSILNYTSLKYGRIGIALAIAMGMLGSGLSNCMNRTLIEADQIMSVSLYSDLIGKTASFGIPILLFGAKCDLRTLVGFSLIAGGILIQN